MASPLSWITNHLSWSPLKSETHWWETEDFSPFFPGAKKQRVFLLKQFFLPVPSSFSFSVFRSLSVGRPWKWRKQERRRRRRRGGRFLWHRVKNYDKVSKFHIENGGLVIKRITFLNKLYQLPLESWSMTMVICIFGPSDDNRTASLSRQAHSVSSEYLRKVAWAWEFLYFEFGIKCHFYIRSVKFPSFLFRHWN